MPSLSTASRKPRRAPGLPFILITVFIDVLSWGVTLPVYPRLMQSLTHGDVAKAAALVGVFTTLFFGVQLFAAPVLGALSDRFGRRPVILTASLGLGVDLAAMVWMVFCPSLWVMVITRVVHAVSAAIGPMALAYIADVTPPEARTRAFGRYLAVFSTGIIVGPALGGLLGQVTLWLPFAAGAVFALLNTAYGLFALPESLPKAQRRALTLKAANPIGAHRLLQARHHIGLPCDRRVPAHVRKPVLVGVVALFRLPLRAGPPWMSGCRSPSSGSWAVSCSSSRSSRRCAGWASGGR